MLSGNSKGWKTERGSGVGRFRLKPYRFPHVQLIDKGRYGVKSSAILFES